METSTEASGARSVYPISSFYSVAPVGRWIRDAVTVLSTDIAVRGRLVHMDAMERPRRGVRT